MSLTRYCAKAAMTLACVLAVSGVAVAADGESAVMQSPAADGAYVMNLQGMTTNYKIRLLDGKRKTFDDGVVIRQSYVKDGKGVIPAAGLYTTSRCSNWWSFNDHVFTIASKKYHYRRVSSGRGEERHHEARRHHLRQQGKDPRLGTQGH